MVRVGIIGLGFGARVHYPAISAIPGVEVVSMCGRDASRLSWIKRQFPDVTPYENWESLTASSEIDAVIVALRPSDQREVVCRLLEKGRHVLCEKPFGLNLDDAFKMQEAAQKNKRVNGIDFQFRFNPGICRLQEFVSSGYLGEIERADVAWLSGGRVGRPYSWQNGVACGGGVLNGYVSHVFDYLRWILKSDVTQVLVVASVNEQEQHSQDNPVGAMRAEDSVECLLRYANGVQSNITVSNCHPHGFGHRIEIVGERGRAIFMQPPFSESSDYQVKARFEIANRIEEISEVATWDNHTQGVAQVAEGFIQAIRRQKAENLADFQDGLQSACLIEAARDSIKVRQWKSNISR